MGLTHFVVATHILIAMTIVVRIFIWHPLVLLKDARTIGGFMT
jgi:hypothetical protein